jgi:hypothetical protein
MTPKSNKKVAVFRRVDEALGVLGIEGPLEG